MDAPDDDIERPVEVAAENIHLASVHGDVHSKEVPTLASLGLSEACLTQLASVGVEVPEDLARLAIMELAEVPTDRPAPLAATAHLIVRRIAEEFYWDYLVPELYDPRLSMKVSDGGVEYRFEIESPDLRLSSRIELPADLDIADFLAAGAGALETDCAVALDRVVDPLADLRQLLCDLTDPPGTARQRDRISAEEFEILTRRFGLGGAPKATLEALGAERGCTRERIRQLEARCLKLLARQTNRGRLERLVHLIEGLATHLETDPDAEVLINEFVLRFPSTLPPVAGWLKLLAAVQGPRWEHLEMREYPGLKTVVGRILARAGESGLAELVTEVAEELTVGVTPGLEARIRSLDLCEVDRDTVRLAAKAASTRIRRMRAIREYLSTNGATHFTQIAEGIASQLGSQAAMNPRNVHAWLDRNQDNFVWVGPGTYRLREAGDAARERESLPANYAPSRRRGIGDAIVRLLLEQQPRSLEEIESHILPYFAVNRGSVGASILQDRAGRFIMTDDRQVFLRDADIAAFEAEKPKASGLIDWGEVAAELADFADSADPAIALEEPDERKAPAESVPNQRSKRGVPLGAPPRAANGYPDFFKDEQLIPVGSRRWCNRAAAHDVGEHSGPRWDQRRRTLFADYGVKDGAD